MFRAQDRVFKTYRFQNLPVTGGAFRFLPGNKARQGLILINRGTGAVYISSNQPDGATGFPLQTNDSINCPWGTAPTVAMFAIGDAGHDLRVFEVLDVSTAFGDL